MKVLIADQKLVTEIYLASAHRVYEICKQRELGTWVEIGGLHFGKAVEG